ncbi:cytochrome P450 [Mycena pura]|uniref:Cytochrome P450 n=1 Tax=Mycena pura TaxID=153505 RepID=A0AAD6YLJ7_9AGAR|nr:cytochrome P450 [Mycena pura]
MLQLNPLAAMVLAAVSGLWLLSRRRWKSRAQGNPLPPGPPSKLLIGNILHVSPKQPWFKLYEYKKQYGDLVFFYGLGNNVLVLNTMEAVSDLLDKRGNIYSHRPEFTVVGELMALGQSMPLLPYGNEWRAHRKLAHVALSPGAVKQYHELQEDLAALLNKAILNKPEEFFSHYIAQVQLSILAHETMDMIGKATVPGAYLADLIPICKLLKHLPSWFPFHKEARLGRAMIDEFVTKPYEHVKHDLSVGEAKPSLTQRLLSSEKVEGLDNYEHRVKWTAGASAMYGAGGETTYSTVLLYIMLMAMHPEIQSADRLPVIADRSQMPYLPAVTKETMRWHLILPLNDVYFKGTTVLPNVWAIALESDGKYDPESFIPKRFLDSSIQPIDPNLYAFGFGRRICPGQYLAQNSLFVIMANLASAFDIFPPAEGKIEPSFGPNLVSYPEPFKCIIKPRSASKATLVESRAGQCNV